MWSRETRPPPGAATRTRPPPLRSRRSPRPGGSWDWTDPALVQRRYFGGILTGNWGLSIHTHQPVLSDIGTAAPASLELVTAALIIALAVAVPLGLVAARWPGGLVDQAIRAVSILGVSMPIFWMALILQLVFAARPLRAARGRMSTLPACCSATRSPTGPGSA